MFDLFMRSKTEDAGNDVSSLALVNYYFLFVFLGEEVKFLILSMIFN